MNGDGDLQFPDGFRWGVATSAFQCEGAVDNPASTWARWEALGHVRAGNRSGVGVRLVGERRSATSTSPATST